MGNLYLDGEEPTQENGASAVSAEAGEEVLLAAEIVCSHRLLIWPFCLGRFFGGARDRK